MSLRAGRVLFVLAVLATAAPARAADDYTLGPDSLPQPDVPAGAIHKFSLAHSRRFPGTQRDYWVYVPAQYRAAVPACVMVFQDGERFVKVDGNWRVPVVFDNLIHRKQMPVTIGVFVNPGITPPASPDAQPRFNRSLEYDGLGDGYVRFLLEELLPEVGKRWNLSREPGCRGIGGSSSGAIAAFTAAWHRPDAFQRVFSSIGTYVGLRGGDGYPALVRKSEARPIRVFLQDGSNDNDGYGGSWWYANQAMLAALQFAGYEVQHVWGDGAHDHKHGSSVLPDALRYLWKGFPASPRAAGGARQPVVEVVDPTGDWQPVGEGYRSVGGLAAGPGGEIYVSDAVAGRIDRIDAQGNRRVFVAASDGAAGLAVGPDGRLYGAQPGRGRIVAWDAQGRPTVIAEGIAASDLVIARDRTVFAAEPRAGRVWSINARGKRIAASGLGYPNGLSFTPDQAWLYVSDGQGRFVRSFAVQPDGTLAHGQPFCHLHLGDEGGGSGADGLAVDVTGRLYVATPLGVQFCDQPGRVNGILHRPAGRWLGQVAFAGPGLDTWWLAAGDRLYRRKSKTRGVISAETPIKPPTPRL
jgi:enterochelin esterase-like enzyme/sugar lactone lactonase YvrE